MNELKDYIYNSKDVSLAEIALKLRNIQINSLLMPKDSVQNPMPIVFEILSKSPDNISKAEYNRLKCILITFLIAFNVDVKYEDVNLSEFDYGPLFNCSLTLLSKKLDSKKYCDALMPIFSDVFSDTRVYTEKGSFYSIPSLFYLTQIPKMIDNMLIDPEYVNSLSQTIIKAQEIIPKSTSYSFILYLSELIIVLKKVFNDNKQHFNLDFFKLFTILFSRSNAPPSIILSHFFPQWLFFSKQFESPQYKSENNDQTAAVVLLFDKAFQSRHHELHRSFQWFLAFYLFSYLSSEDQIHHMLIAICHSIRTVISIESNTKRNSINETFASSVVKMHTTGSSWKLYSLLEHISSTSRAISLQSFSIHSSNAFDEFSLKRSKLQMIDTQVSFREQVGYFDFYEEYDNDLKTIIKEKIFSDLNACYNDIDSTVRSWELVKKRFFTVVSFQEIFMKSLLPEIVKRIHEKSNDISTYWHFVSLLATDFINMLSSTTYAQCVISVVFSKPFDFSSLPPNTFLMINSNKKSEDLHRLYFRSFDIIDSLPCDFYPEVSRVISRNLYDTLKSGKLSVNLIEALCNIVKEKPNSINGKNSLLFHILNSMVELPFLKGFGFVDHSISEAKLSYEWFVFIIRLALSMQFLSKNSPFSQVLVLYARLMISTIVSGMKRFSIQLYAWKTVQLFSNIISKFVEYPVKSNPKLKIIKQRMMQIDDLKKPSQNDVVSLIIEHIFQEQFFSKVQWMIPVLETGLMSNDERNIVSSLSLMLMAFSDNEISEISYEILHPLFHLCMNTLHFGDDQIIQSFINRLSSFFPLIIQPISPTMTDVGVVLLDDIPVDLNELSLSVLTSMKFQKEEAFYYFSFLSIAFSKLFMVPLQLNDNIRSLLSNLFSIFSYLFSYQTLNDQLVSFQNELIRVFGSRFSKEDSNVFLLCLFDNIGLNKSKGVQPLISLSNSLINESKTSERYIQQTINDGYSFFQTKSRQVSYLTMVSMFIIQYPSSIKLCHIRLIISTSSDIHPFDLFFPTVLNSVLKTYIKNCNPEEKNDLLGTIYELINGSSACVRWVLNKRAKSLGIPLPIRSLADLETQNIPLFFQRFTLALLCGVSFEIPITDSIRVRTVDFVKKKDESLHLIDQLSRAIVFCWALIQNKQAFQSFCANENASKQIITFVNYALNVRFAAIRRFGKKIVRTFLEKYGGGIQLIDNIESLLATPSKGFVMNQNPEIGPYYIRLMKLMPKKVPLETIDYLCNILFEILQKKDDEKLIASSFILQIIEALSIEQFMSLESTKSYMNRPYRDADYITFIIRTYSLLLFLPDIPLLLLSKRFLLRFFKVFHKEASEAIFKNNCGPSALSLLYEIITTDDSDIVFRSVINVVGNIPDFHLSNPCNFVFFKRLSELPRFAKMDVLNAFLEQAFALLFKICLDFNKIGDFQYSNITHVALSLINIYKHSSDVAQILKFSQIFKISYFMGSDVNVIYVKHLVAQLKTPLLKKMMIMSYKAIGKLVKLCEVILPHSFKALQSIDENASNNLWDIVLKILEYSNCLHIGLHTSQHLLEKCLPSNSVLKDLYKYIEIALSSSDISSYVYALKLINALAQKDLLPPIIFYSVFNQMFTYNKFTDPPYVKHLISILKSKPQYLDCLPNESIEVLSFFFHDKLSMSKDLQKLTLILTSVPQILKYLPFSFVTYVLSLLEPRFENPEVDEIIILTYNFCKCIPCLKPEIDSLVFFIYRLLRDKNSSKKRIDVLNYFGMFILDFGSKDTFPFECIEDINASVTLNNFILIASAIYFDPLYVISRNMTLVENAIGFVLMGDMPKLQLYIERIFNSLFSSSEAFFKTQRLIYQTFEKCFHLLGELSSFLCKKILGCQYLDGFHYILNHVESFYTQIRPSDSYRKSQCFEFAMKHLLYVPYQYQIEYFSTFVSKISDVKENKSILLRLSYEFVKSTLITPSVKHQVILYLASNPFEGSISEFEILANSIMNQHQLFSSSISSELIPLYLIIASQDGFAERLRATDFILALLPTDFELALEQLLETLPLTLWEDRFIITITSLFYPRSNSWYSIFSLGPRIKKVGERLLVDVFSRYINAENCNLLVSLLNNIVCEKPYGMYQSLFNGSIIAFETIGIKYPYQFMSSIANHSSYPHYLSFYSEINVFPILPFSDIHKIEYTCHSLDNPSKLDEIGLSLVRLSQYSAATSVFSQYEIENPYIIHVNESLTSIVSFLSSSNEASHSMSLLSLGEDYKCINEGMSRLIEMKIRREMYDYKNDTEMIYHGIVSFVKSKMSLDKNDIQKIVGISLILSTILKDSVSTDEYSQYLNPIVFGVVESIKKCVTGNSVRNTLPMMSCVSAVQLMPSFTKILDHHSGFSSNGLVSVSRSDIDDYFKLVSMRVSSEQMLVTDWRHFASFCYNMFLIQDNVSMFSPSFTSYNKILSYQKRNSRLIDQEVILRLLLLVQFAYELDNMALIDLVRDTQNLFSVYNISLWKPWSYQLIKLLKNDSFLALSSDLIAQILPDICYFGGNIPDSYIKDIDLLKNRNKMNEKHNLSVMFDVLFSNDVFSYQRGSVLKEFMNDIRIHSEYSENENELIGLFYRFAQSHSLLQSEVDCVADIPSFIRSVSDSNLNTASLVDTVFGYSMFSSTIDSIHSAINDISLHLPISLQPLNGTQMVSLLFISPKIVSISEDTILISSSTTNDSSSTFIVFKSPTDNQKKTNILLMSNSLQQVKAILTNSYSTNSRQSQIISPPIYEVGESYIMFPLPSQGLSLEHAFRKHFGIVSSQASFSVPHDDQYKYSLLKMFVSQYSKEQHIKYKSIMLSSYSTMSLIRHVFQFGYPNMQEIVFYPEACSFSLLTTKIEIDKSDIQPHLRLSPNIATFFGKYYCEDIRIGVSATARALTENLEALRPYFEEFVMESTSDCSLVLPERESREERFLSLSPPVAIDTSIEISETWFDSLNSLLENSINPQSVPYSAFSWF